MARPTRATAHKRAREKAQQERQREKQQRRLEAREKKGVRLLPKSAAARIRTSRAFGRDLSPGLNGSMTSRPSRTRKPTQKPRRSNAGPISGSS